MEHDVEHALGLPEVHHDEQGAHDHGRHGHEFAEDDHALEFLVVVEIGGQDQHHGRGRHADEIGELRNIQPPGDLTIHARDAETALELVQIDKAAARDDAEQKEQPHIIALGTGKQFLKHGQFSLDEVVDAGLRAQIGLAANTVVGGQGLTHR